MSKISFRYVRMATAIIMVLTVIVVTTAVFSFRTVVNRALQNQCDTVLSVLSKDEEDKKQETAKVAKGFSENAQMIQGIAARDAGMIANGFKSTDNPGVFAAFSDASGTLLWKSDNFTGAPGFCCGFAEKAHNGYLYRREEHNVLSDRVSGI